MASVIKTEALMIENVFIMSFIKSNEKILMI